MMNEHKLVAQHFNNCIDVTRYTLTPEYDYGCIPLCAIDSVFSMGIRYTNVIKIVDRVCKTMNITKAYEKENQSPITTSWFFEQISEKTHDDLAEQLFGSRNRTSPKNGILKAEAVVRFMRVLKEFGVEHLGDLNKIVDSVAFERAILAIPGQTSGICLKYFFMLAGDSELIKPDRMIIRFLTAALNRPVNLHDAVGLVRGACDELKQKYAFMTPKILDNLIWQYQRSR